MPTTFHTDYLHYICDLNRGGRKFLARGGGEGRGEGIGSSNDDNGTISTIGTTTDNDDNNNDDDDDDDDGSTGKNIRVAYGH